MTKNVKNTLDKLHIALISVHGLIRGDDLELGRDPDTGGQTKYVVEVACALAKHPYVGRVDLFTRQIIDPSVSEDYSQIEESLGGEARIVRIDAGPEGYIRKEELWDYLDAFADNMLNYLREIDRTPDIVHSHYADAGYVGVRIAHQLGVPLVHTGHSLGRVKRRRLLATGLTLNDIETRYHMMRRVEAEEETLATANLVVVSTRNEIEEQYRLYDHYQPERMSVVPPGTDLTRFYPPTGEETSSPLAGEIARFLRDPKKPMILAVSRADERKNVAALVRAYGESPELQKIANLVISAGTRDDIRDLDSATRDVLTDLILLIDQYDLYGRVAYPKQIRSEEVSLIYRLATISKGVFVNPALTEPFGLTLIEAAASALPIVATEDGGPTDIIGNCENGFLIDPLDTDAIASAVLKVLTEKENWQQLSDNGLKGVQTYYSWQAHAENYLEELKPALDAQEKSVQSELPRRHPLLFQDRALIVDLDFSLLGNREELDTFLELLRGKRRRVGFGIVTARGIEFARRLLKKSRILTPDVLIAGMGTELYYAPQFFADTAWGEHIDHQWHPKTLRRILNKIPGLSLCPRKDQLYFKLRYTFDVNEAPNVEYITRTLRQEGEPVNLFQPDPTHIELTPVRASKGLAVRYFSDQWGIPLEKILVAGGSASDEDMIRGNTLGSVIANPNADGLSHLAEGERVYFSKSQYAQGILEAIDHYDFFGACCIPPAS
uniref:sucrose-phosphate synthase n=1 Tax=Candidatus Kentrum sp. TUN TaxID=2126343 RepID=A0A451AN54_9GAMM|nr:MAG: sucrose-phosphate synthase [Candidatus Kentron sp. TUN]VFK61287.1 MAG: sucrose-phosphate synthase [Candidatus Kentron sp. TUN]VFK67428.1 MAG: sucrose-phosphate synthase [Candidatus Kentron sp. TUN]